MQPLYRLTISCPDKTGIVAAVSNFVAAQGGNLIEANYHTEQESHWFFMRNEISFSAPNFNMHSFEQQFSSLAEKFAMQWKLIDSSRPKKIVLLVSQHSHCLADILHRWHSGDLAGEVVAVISNHNSLSDIAQWYKVPFHHLPVTKDDKEIANQAIASLLGEYQADTIVLARYMQIIPPAICDAYKGRMINIHHSFLPSFVGANPYERAYQRGVKLIGATCHYVTSDLDEGPIIEQDVVRVSHRQSKEDMLKNGKDVERVVLARGLQYHLEDRVMVHGRRTVILE